MQRKKSARRKITYDLVKQEFDSRGYILLSKKYKNNATPLEYICPKHKDKGVLSITFANFTRGEGCPYCGGKVRKTTEEYRTQLAKAKPTIEAIDEYISLKEKITHRCLVCGYVWSAKPANLLYNKNGCPQCGKRAPLSQEKLIQRVAEIDDSIEVVGEYINTQTKIEFRCKECGHIWEAKPNNILNGKGCPNCKKALSKGAKKVEECLQARKIAYQKEYIFEDCADVHPLPFDFYLPEHNICIEYDGEQHFVPSRFGGISLEDAEENLVKAQMHDKIKDEYCKKHSIRLIRIPYYDFKEIENIISLI